MMQREGAPQRRMGSDELGMQLGAGAPTVETRACPASYFDAHLAWVIAEVRDAS